jgi:hypothetical protein
MKHPTIIDGRHPITNGPCSIYERPTTENLPAAKSSRTSNVAKALAILCAAGCAGGHALAQSNTYLPVYHVVQSGASATQAGTLAADLGIPSGQMTVSNGMVMFIDPTNYLNIPTMSVTNQYVVSNLTAQTINRDPALPLTFEQIDFGTLSNRPILDPTSAVSIASFALSDAGLTPQFGAPVALNNRLTTYMNNAAGGTTSNSQALDTEVDYHFTDQYGHPFIGPGAQLQMSFDGQGNVGRLNYAVRSITESNRVLAISASEALNRVIDLFPPGTQVADPDVEYYCPPFWWHWPFPCPCPPPPWQVENILPYYVFRGTTQVVNPITGEQTQVQELTQMIPATDDPAFVPSVNLSASFGTLPGSAQTYGVNANVAVTGGTPPYTYEWRGSSGAMPSNNVPSFTYSPVTRVIQPTLSLSAVAPGVLNISWPPYLGTNAVPDPYSWILETAPALFPGRSNNWSNVTNIVGTNQFTGTISVTVSNTGANAYFRLRLASNSIPTMETVNVTVTDANGVSVQAHQNLMVQATPVLVVAHGGGGIFSSGPQWGTESPVDPGLGATDTADWRARMLADPGAGSECFLWTLNTAWLGDFINPPVPHVVPPNPMVNGDDDYHNWGVDSADIVLYIGHGNPTVITFSVTPPLFFNNPQLNKAWGATPDVGYDPLDWLCLLSCEVLSNNWSGLTAPQRWGGAFDGLHVLTGFKTLAWAGTGFTGTFADNMMLGAPQTIVKSWFNAAMADGTGLAAAMGPIGPGNTLDFNDHYWGKGPVGPTIKAPQIQGWWYVSQ